MASEDSYRTLTLKGTPITELRITDIKKELEKRGLPKSGSKTQLVDRLKGQLLLEKLQQDAAQSSGDEHEGKVPNMALQRDDKAGQSEFVRQYLQQQQRNLEIQMEMKKQVQEERKKQSADESSADEYDIRANSQPDVTSPKAKAEDSNAPAKMSRPGRKSGRNSSKGENGPEGQQATEKTKSPIFERSQSESSSSSHSPSPERSSWSRKGTRGRAKRGGSRRGGQHGTRGSRSSSPSSSPEVMPQKKQRRRTNSSSRSGSRSPQMVSPEVPTRRSSRRSSAALKSTPDQVQEEEMPHDGGDDKSKKVEQDDTHEPTTQRKRWRKKPPAKVVGEPEATHKIQEESVNTQSTTVSIAASVPADNSREGGQASGDGGTVSQSEPVAAHSTETAQSSHIPVTQQAAPTSQAHKVTTSPRTARDDVTSNCKQETEAAATVKVYHTNKPGDTTARQDNEAARKAEAEKSSLHTEETKIHNSDKKKEENASSDTKKVMSPVRTENRKAENVSSDTKKVMSPVRTESRDQHSPLPGERQRKKSYSSDSSSSRSRSRSKSFTGGRRRAPSSSSSRSSSPGNSPVRRSSVGSQGKNRPGPAVTQAVPMEVDATREKDVPIAKNLRLPGKEAAVPVSAPPTSEPRPSGVLQEDKQKLVNKEHEVTAQETAKTQDKTSTQTEAAENVTHAAEVEDEAVSKKGVKKRKWGSKTSKAAKTTKRTSSMEISSDVLKNLIGDVKLTETVFEMETEVVNTLDYDEQEEDRRDVRVKKQFSQSPAPREEEEVEETKADEEDARKVEARAESSPEAMEVEHAEPEKKIIRLSSAAPKVAGKTKLKVGKKSKEEKRRRQQQQLDSEEVKDDPVSERDNKDKMFATTRPIKPLLPLVDEPELVSENQSPAHNTPDRVIRIAGLVRPFTVGQLKELLRRTGELDDDYFWINAIKSHCLAAYKKQEDAVVTRAALHGTRWPQSNPKILIVDYATIEDVTHRRAEGLMPLLPAAASTRQQPQQEQKKAKVLVEKVDDEKEKRLKAREQRDKDRRDREKEVKERQEAKERKREPEKKNQIREWDRDKIQQMSRSRSKSRDKDRMLRRSQDRDRRKRGQQTREKKDEERRKEKKQKDTKTEEEPPAKLLDDLFRKTKAVPCIYWLPLTEEQAQQRVVKKQELEKERLKRIEERDKEELKKRESARLALQREREKASDKNRERERERGKQNRGRSRSRSRSRRRR